jgi:hypothetical protein
MTKKELNKIKTTVFNLCIEQMTPEELTVFDGGYNSAYLYEIHEASKYERIWVSHKTQINTNTFKNHGFTENAEAVLLISLNKKTKCADYINLK